MSFAHGYTPVVQSRLPGSCCLAMDDEKEEREVSEEPVEEKGHEGEKAPEEGEGGEEGEEEVPHGDLPKVNPEGVYPPEFLLIQ